ncbi:MAG: ATP-binding cassette domain-containing protein [Chitinophagales bacterium]|jgi:ABC-type multidrug transport system fused ATPase/permease subunit|nr:ATP-binding cassette domain-containing protein [Bacteroidota bacterium]MBK7567678.1 ATP-binding cassette domain-containing protein [Bacteroidota bacterium]MBP8915444.1 ATP-binding cassette domain-containing protein [Chitinophagales bacterium]MBP9220212.1 ATP-binding cassette domain-containing protein [Chitinophagales bacterium]
MSEPKRKYSPIDDRDKKKISRQSIKVAGKIFSYIRPYRSAFLIGIVFLLLSSFTTMTLPWFMGKLIDSAKGNNTIVWMNNTNTIALILIATLLVQSILSFFRVYLFATVSEKAMADVRTNFFDKMLTLPIPFYETRRVGELTSRSTNDVDQLQDMLGATLPEFVRQMVTIVFGVAFIFYISPQLTLMMMCTFPVLVLIAVFYGKFIRKISKQRQDALANSNVVVEETLQNINTVKTFTNENYESKRYKTFMQKVVETGIKGAVNRGGFSTFLILGLFGGFVAVIWYGTTLLKAGEIFEGDLFSFVLYTGFIGGAVGGLGDLYGRLQKTVGASERIFEILNEKSELDLLSEPDQKIKLEGKIELKDIVFSYPTRQDINVLDGISLTVNRGDKIALAGYSGAGKSTIAQLIMQIYPLEKGKILFDGKESNSYSIRQLRFNMAVVPQEVLLFGGTIGENIAYGKPGASDDELIEAAKKANAWQFISQFPEKLNTIVGERGVKLSGGQRQRIAIARAILKDPAILILDEATSSLDAESEKLVQDALEELMKNRTTIIIAHRLSTIRNVDTIFVLNKGKIMESGSFEQLSKMENGLFNNLLKLQFEEKNEKMKE